MTLQELKPPFTPGSRVHGVGRPPGGHAQLQRAVVPLRAVHLRAGLLTVPASDVRW